MRKSVLMCIVFCLLFVLVGGFVAAGVVFADEVGSIASEVQSKQSGGTNAIAEEIDRIATGIVNFVRGIFAVIAVVFVVWAGFVIWGAGGDPNQIMQAKKLCAGFLICVIGVYAAETIVGGILGLFGFGA